MDENPPIVFIDTSAFEAENFAFGGELLSAVVDSCNDSMMELVMVDVTADEIRRRIRKNATTAKKAVSSALKEARLLGHDRDVWLKIRDKNYYKQLGEQVVAAFDDFLEKAKVTHLKADDVRPSQVFKNYFAVEPPFAAGAKEKEFPDAFAFEAVLQLSKSRGRKVNVVSVDDDFTKACEKHDCLISMPYIESAIEYSLRTRDALVDACHEWIYSNVDMLFECAETRLKEVQFTLEAPSGKVNSVEHLDMELDDIAVVELEDTHAVIVAPVTAKVRFNIDYEAEGESYYDADDRLVIPYVDVQRDLDVYLVFPARITVNIETRDLKDMREVVFNITDEVEITPHDDAEFNIESI